ncbi:hypothetical protein TNCV_1691041 [Trichonephila clavipes]|nr:hypothetical protein TNCV_1691041 [Trichonephila clavipes]
MKKNVVSSQVFVSGSNLYTGGIFVDGSGGIFVDGSKISTRNSDYLVTTEKFLVVAMSYLSRPRTRGRRSSKNPLRRSMHVKSVEAQSMSAVAEWSRYQPCHALEPSTTQDSPCRAAMHARSFESLNVLPLV